MQDTFFINRHNFFFHFADRQRTNSLGLSFHTFKMM